MRCIGCRNKVHKPGLCAECKPLVPRHVADAARRNKVSPRRVRSIIGSNRPAESSAKKIDEGEDS